MAAEERIAVAYIMRSKGIRGEVRARLLTSDPRRFDQLRDVVIQRSGDSDLATRLQGWRTERDDVLLKFSGIDSPEQAKARLAGGYVTIAPDQAPELPADTYYVHELVGCAVVHESGEILGELVEVLEMPSTDVYRVEGPRGEILVPAVGDFVVDVKIAQRQITVRSVEGLIQG
jgi:16S rRNA processing protein RimM